MNNPIQLFRILINKSLIFELLQIIAFRLNFPKFCAVKFIITMAKTKKTVDFVLSFPVFPLVFEVDEIDYDLQERPVPVDFFEGAHPG